MSEVQAQANVGTYSPIAPITLLEQIHDKQLLLPHMLVLAHDVLPNRGRYLDLVYSVMGDEGYLILDNSVVELGVPMHAAALIEAAKAISASAIVLPDVLGNFPETRMAIELSLPAFDGWLADGGHLMKVPQGSNWTELVECIHWMHEAVPGNVWGVPRHIANTLGTRSVVLQYLNDSFPEDLKIHLLGMSQNLLDDLQCTRYGNVMGIDSANPVVLGQSGYYMNTSKYVHMNRGNYWDNTFLTHAAVANIRYMHIMLGADIVNG